MAKRRREQFYVCGAKRVHVCAAGGGRRGGGLHVKVYCIDVKHEFLSHMAVCACNIPALHEDAQQLHKIDT